MKTILCTFVFIAGLLGALPSARADIYDFTMNTIDGTPKPLADYKGKTLLIVNTASQCGLTPQYKSLETLYQKYKDRGLEILAFPSNNFGSQEPGSNAQIKEFCELNYKITFPLFAKISVAGDDIDPLYRYLTTASGFEGPISWNFNKFLVWPDGRVMARFDSKVDPLSADLVDALESSLPQ